MLNYLAKYRSQHDVTAEKQHNMGISSATYLLRCFSVLREVRESNTVLCKVAFIIQSVHVKSSFGGLGVACWPLEPKFAGSNPAEAVGFLGRKKSSARLPSEGK